jgi:hypothetical protein
MKEIISSEFEVELEHKHQKMQEVELALANLNNIWRELQMVWSRKQFDIKSVEVLDNNEDTIKGNVKFSYLRDYPNKRKI